MNSMLILLFISNFCWQGKFYIDIDIVRIRVYKE